MPFKLSSAFWIGLVSILVLFIAFCLQSRFFSQREEPQPLTFYEELKLHIHQIRFNTSDIRLKTIFPSSRTLTPNLPLLVPLAFKSISEALVLVKDKKPFLFESTDVQSWHLLSSDIWDLAYRWPLLNAVLKLKVDGKRHVDAKRMPVFIAEFEPLEGGVIGVATEAGRPEVTNEMLFAQLLTQASSEDNKFFYSTNFRIMERIMNVSYLLSFSSLF